LNQPTSHKNLLSEKIKNNVTGQTIYFFDSSSNADEVLEMQSTYASLSAEPPMHYHPKQTEIFEVLSGVLTLKVKDEIRVLRVGDGITIPPNTHHAMWNAGAKETLVSWTVYPPLKTKPFLKTMFKLANNGETNREGVPSVLLMIFLLKKYQDTISLVKPNQKMVKLLYFILIPLFKFKKYHEKFGGF
jgi:quercetin dioxygenase-like cupin family protein